MQAKGTLQRYLQLRSQDLFPNLFTVDKTKQQAPVVQTLDSAIRQAPVVQTLDSAIHRINHYPADKYYGNQLRYPLDRDLSGG